jgi:hypothetical protein
VRVEGGEGDGSIGDFGVVAGGRCPRRRQTRALEVGSTSVGLARASTETHGRREGLAIDAHILKVKGRRGEGAKMPVVGACNRS